MSKNKAKTSKVQGKPIDKSYKFPPGFQELSSPKSFYILPQPESIISDQIITIDNFFSKKLCQELIRSFEQGITLETTPIIKSKEYAVRFNDRASLTDLNSADILWKYLGKVLEQGDPDIQKVFNNACGLNPQLRLYRYKKGHHFNKHYDESVVCKIPPEGIKQGRTKWTLLIYLTGGDEFKGGGTIFYPELRNVEPLNIHPSKGMALLHKHGDDCLKHEAEMVQEGEKWVLRSDVIYL
ncbi:hypothetical protein JA1_002444 [Spathaspora sp. JA1]|nr:hypothetical protein JA1_002444 [Spathaspora sp. JA1]